jgi:hypothetical protein
MKEQEILKAQQILNDAAKRTVSLQKEAISHAILRYPYAPRDGQRDALHHLIFRKKDLPLIAKTSFGKSMDVGWKAPVITVPAESFHVPSLPLTAALPE